jgi:hypothetical protein
MPIRFIISELILNGNKPEGPIRQGRRIKKNFAMSLSSSFLWFILLCCQYFALCSIEWFGDLMNNEWESIWKEVVVAKSRYSPGIWLEGLRVAGVPAKIQNGHFQNRSLDY